MKINYKLYQIQKDKIRDFGFMGLDMMKNLNIKLDGANYVKTYEGEIEAESVDDALNTLFRKFNIDRPADFKYHSMSVGDIITIDNVNHFVDSFGFEAVEIDLSGSV
jgi:hypothetical protein